MYPRKISSAWTEVTLRNPILALAWILQQGEYWILWFMGYKFKSRWRIFFCFWKVPSSHRKAPNVNVTAHKRSCGKVAFVSEAFVCSQGGFCPGGLCPGGSLSRGLCPERDLCPEGISVKRVCVGEGGICQEGLCPGGGNLCASLSMEVSVTETPAHYGLRTGGKHPTRMHPCANFFLLRSWNVRQLKDTIPGQTLQGKSPSETD